LRSLVLIETSSDPEPRENISRYRLLKNVVRVLGPWSVKKQVAQIMLGKTILTERSRHSEVERFSDLMAKRRDIWRAVNGVIDRAGIHDELARITSPTVIVVGDEDVATPRAKAEKIASAIAHAKLVTIPRAGHSATVEEPAAVTAAIESFLTALPRT
jgi:pimeloyl-ACP methyl ester carboxylesterase